MRGVVRAGQRLHECLDNDSRLAARMPDRYEVISTSTFVLSFQVIKLVHGPTLSGHHFQTIVYFFQETFGAQPDPRRGHNYDHRVQGQTLSGKPIVLEATNFK